MFLPRSAIWSLGLHHQRVQPGLPRTGWSKSCSVRARVTRRMELVLRRRATGDGVFVCGGILILVGPRDRQRYDAFRGRVQLRPLLFSPGSLGTCLWSVCRISGTLATKCERKDTSTLRTVVESVPFPSHQSVFYLGPTVVEGAVDGNAIFLGLLYGSYPEKSTTLMILRKKVFLPERSSYHGTPPTRPALRLAGCRKN